MNGFLWIVIAGLPSLLLAQPDCVDLGFGNGVSPAPGNGLRYCASDADQCCTPPYITSVENQVRVNMQRSLRNEFDNVIDGYLDDFEDLIDYLKEDFRMRMVDALPGSNFINRSDAALGAVIGSLVENLNIEEDDGDDSDGDDSDGDESDGDESDGDESDDDPDLDSNDDSNDDDPDDDSASMSRFEPQEFVQSLGEILGELVVRALVAQYPGTEQCVERVALRSLNSEALTELAELVQDLRQATSTLSRVGGFLEGQRTRLSRATILQACVSRFINLAFCSRCSKKTPPLCFNTCNALMRGCYSPYYTTLNRQYSRLWDIVRQVVGIANTTIQDILETEREIIDYETFLQELNSDCGIDLQEKRSTKREEDSEDEDTAGDHNSSGSESSEDNDSSEDSSDDDSSEDSSDNDGDGSVIPPGLVRRTLAARGAFEYSEEGLELCQYSLVNSNCTAQVERNYCKQTDICTSKCYCTDDGVNTRDTDTEPFTLSDIDDQDQNPVLSIDMDELRAQAGLIEDEDPVAEFLSSNTFKEVAPDGVVDDDNEDENDGTTSLLTSATVILLSLLVTFV